MLMYGNCISPVFTVFGLIGTDVTIHSCFCHCRVSFIYFFSPLDPNLELVLPLPFTKTVVQFNIL